MHWERITLIVVGIVLTLTIFYVGYLHGQITIALDQLNEQKLIIAKSRDLLDEQTRKYRDSLEKYRDSLDEQNRKIAALEIKLQFCIDEVTSLRRSRQP